MRTNLPALPVASRPAQRHPSSRVLQAALLSALGLVASASAQAPPPAAAATAIQAIHCGALFDSDAGRMRGASTIVVRGDRIESVVDGTVAGPAGARVIELGNATCLPGLIDSHTHLTQQISRSTSGDQFRWNVADYAIRGTVHAARTLQAGFTTVRDVGDIAGESIALRNAINAGVLPGPRIYTAGVAIGSTGGHADATNGYRKDLAGDPGPANGIINSPEDAWKAVRQHYKDGVDLIKVIPSGGVLDESTSGDNPQLTLEEMRAVVDAAHDYGFTVAAHAHGAEGIRRAVLAGVDSIEHGTYADATDLKLMKEHGTWYVPTITAGKSVAANAAIPGYYPPQIAAKAARIGPLIQDSAGRAYRAGVRIAFGTDAGVYPHGENGKEFQFMVDAGMPAAYVLQSATTHAAQLLRHGEDIGSLGAGKFADIVAVPGDPLRDMQQMQQVSFVMKAGTVYRQDGQPVMP